VNPRDYLRAWCSRPINSLTMTPMTSSHRACRGNFDTKWYIILCHSSEIALGSLHMENRISERSWHLTLKCQAPFKKVSFSSTVNDRLTAQCSINRPVRISPLPPIYIWSHKKTRKQQLSVGVYFWQYGTIFWVTN